MKPIVIGFILAIFCATAAAEDLAPPVVDATQQPSAAAAADPEAPVVSANAYAQTDTPAAAPAASATGSAVLLSKISALQDQIQTLNGKAEVLDHEVSMLKQQQQAFYQDVDARLNQLSSGAKAAPKATDFDSPQTAIEKKPVAAVSPKPTAISKASSDPSDEDKGAYMRAYNLIQTKQFDQAKTALQKFIAKYPKSDYVANATYWLGDLYMNQGNADLAIKEFETVVEQFPGSSKAADAQLKLGFAYYNKGQWAKARQALQVVKRNYPDTSVARLASARIKDMDKQHL